MTNNTQAAAERLQAELKHGFALLQAHRFEDALRVGQAVCSQANHYADAHHLVALAQMSLSQSAAAETAFRHAAQLAPRNAHIHSNFGNLLRTAGRLQEASDAYRNAVSADPNFASAWFKLGLMLRFLGKPKEALTCYDRAEHLGVQGPELLDARGSTLIDLGEIDQALRQIKTLTETFPQHSSGHVTLANLLWQYGESMQPSQDPLPIFRQSADAQPANGQLQLAYIGFLLEIRQTEEALQRIRQLRQREEAPVLMALEADALDRLGELQQAGALYNKSYQSFGQNDTAFLNSYARHLFKSGHWDHAANMAERATLLNPLDQEGWANLGTAWRLLDDPREYWLMDYDLLITSVAVEPPTGYQSMAAFLEELRPALDSRHKSSREPAQQSLRGGSQTEGQLFGRNDPVIDKAETALISAVNRHIANLPDDPAHPFLSRKTNQVKMLGSWSVKLRSSGNHVNHIHSKGWVSSAFYVSLPDSVKNSESQENPAGWICFGQPPDELGLNLLPRRSIQPKEGYLALFPSYMWHGTVPFTDTTARVSIAFDMITTH
jgi:tetratricopeptide (TPR) repeat protein